MSFVGPELFPNLIWIQPIVAVFYNSVQCWCSRNETERSKADANRQVVVEQHDEWSAWEEMNEGEESHGQERDGGGGPHQHLTLGGTSSPLAWCSALVWAWGWWRGGWGWGSVRAGDGWWWWWWWGSWERRWSCAKLEVTPPGSLKDWERDTTGGGGGGEGAALLLLFRAARWDHWTF